MGLVGLGEFVNLECGYVECGGLTPLSVAQAFAPGSGVEKDRLKPVNGLASEFLNPGSQS